MKKNTEASYRRQFAGGAVLSYLSIALNIAAGLVYTPWMVTRIGQGDYGLYTLANSLITLFLMDFGLGSAVGRYVAQYRAEDRQDKVNNFLGAVYKLYLMIDAVILLALIIVYFLIDQIYVNLTPDEIGKFKIIYLMAAAFSVVNFPFVTLNGILTAYEKFIPLKLADVLYRILMVALTVAALLAGYGVYALVAVHAGVGLLLILYKLAVIGKQLPVKVNFKYADAGLYREIFGFSLWTTVSLLSQRLVFNITPSILGVVANSGAIAVFGIVTTIEAYAYTITSALEGMFLPGITRLYGTEDGERNIQSLYFHVGRFQFALNGLIVAGFVVIGKQFIELWLGRNYLDAYYGLVLVLLPGLFFNAMLIVNTAIVVKNRVRLQAAVNLCMGLINILLSVPLSARYGAVGACISIFIAYAFRTVAMNVIAWRVMHFDVFGFIKKCYIRMSIPIFCTILFGGMLNGMATDGGWGILLAKGMVTAAIYLFLVFYMGFGKGERQKLMGYLHARLHRE